MGGNGGGHDRYAGAGLVVNSLLHLALMARLPSLRNVVAVGLLWDRACEGLPPIAVFREGLIHCSTRHLEWNRIQVSIAALWTP